MPEAKPRFTKSLREHQRSDGTTDRYWVVEDKSQHNFTVLKVSASYPGAEWMAQAYAAELNKLDETVAFDGAKAKEPAS